MKKSVVSVLLALLFILSSCSQALTSSGATGTADPKETFAAKTAGTQTQTTSAVSVPESSEEVSDYEPLILENPGNLYSAVDSMTFDFGDGYDELRNDLPKMDGSTSLIPFEAALRAALYGVSAEEAKGFVSHTTTWGALDNLLDGTADAIFTCPLSDEQRERVREYEKESGVKLKEVPVAMEAFVFVVNAENPVKSLTQKQLRDIYSGKITNWKEVGGRDAGIIAYQRNNDSGSQNYMIDFMKGYELTDAPTQYRAGSMKAAMDAMAYNDNAIDSIGYSVYAYAADMYEDSELINFVAVDGVTPNRTTIDDGSYPLLGYNYLMYFDTGDGRLPLLEKFALSDAVQLEAAKSGYVPVKNVNFDFELMQPEAYAGVGAGRERSDEKIAFEYVSAIPDFYLKTIDLGFIKDVELREEIKAFAETALNKQALLPSRNAPYYKILEKNGFVSMTVYTRYDQRLDEDFYDYDGCKYVDCAIWDLETGKKLSLEECFCRGTDIAAALNKAVGTQLMHMATDWGTYYPTIRDFKGLTKDSWWQIDLENVYLDGRNPYVATGVNLSLDGVDPHLMVWNYERRDTDWVYEEFSERNVVLSSRGVKYSALSKNSFAFALLEEDRFENAAKINKYVTDYMAEHFTLKEGDRATEFMNWRGYILAEKYFILNPSANNADYEAFGLDPGYARVIVFDLDSGERIAFDDILPETEKGKIDQEKPMELWMFSENGALVIRYSYEFGEENRISIPAGLLAL
ncbi:MAG: substrate-binding domain-containing protein [Clostridia bacterium]|nr:substrate-binding domain-containing protein [Clostridia bacterium]